MDPFHFIFIVIGFFIVLLSALLMDDGIPSFKGPHRFVVRQPDNGGTREWICTHYIVRDGKIYFRQEGHTKPTVVAGNWHIEPVTASKG